jgi:hypothetical protein
MRIDKRTQHLTVPTAAPAKADAPATPVAAKAIDGVDKAVVADAVSAVTQRAVHASFAAIAAAATSGALGDVDAVLTGSEFDLDVDDNDVVAGVHAAFAHVAARVAASPSLAEVLFDVEVTAAQHAAVGASFARMAQLARTQPTSFDDVLA